MKNICSAVFTAVLCSQGMASRRKVHQYLRTEISPLVKVISLLSDLEAKLSANGEKEKEAHLALTEWCRDGVKDKGFEIKTAEANIEDLQATLGKAASDISASSAKVEELAGTVATNEADLQAATKIREQEQSEFNKAEAELVDVVDTLDRAINVLERKLKNSALVQAKVNTQDVANLVQVLENVVDAASLSLHDKKRLVALAQNGVGEDDDSADMGAPAAEAYKMHSQGIVEVLEDLREKAETQLAQARKQETSAKHNYAMMRQSLEDQMKADNKEMGEAKEVNAAAAELKATTEGDMAVTKKDLADAQSSLEVMKTSCSTAAADYEVSTKSRAEELKALADAKKVLKESTAGAGTAVYGSSFLQVESTSSHLTTRADLANFEVVNIVRRLARQDKSASMAQLAVRIAAAIKYGDTSSEDPFSKVRALLTDMIEKLEAEAGAEASHKAYCDKEMAGTKEKTDELSSTLDRLSAKIDKMKSQSVTLKSEVNDLNTELADVTRLQADLDKVRGEEHKAYVASKSDHEQGLRGVRQALKVLREYYSPALVQEPEMPERHSKSSGAGTSILGLLEVVESDFGKSLAQLEMDEDSASADYEKISMQNRLTKATNEQAVKYKAKEAAALDKSVAELSSDSESAQSELDAVLEYSKGIRTACVAKPSSYEERKARRQSEMAGLKEALAALEQEAALLQRRRAGLRGASAGTQA